jgi:signal transduction histidine kinase
MMFQALRRRNTLENQGGLATIVVVVVAYVTSFLGATGLGGRYSVNELVILIALGLIYLGLSLSESAVHAASGRLAPWVYFVVLSTLALTIVVLANGSAMWLITMPLIGSAVERLRPWERIPVYVVSLASVGLPVYLAEGWQAALYVTVLFSPAVFFVALFTRIAQVSTEQKVEAERLAAELESANRQLSAYAVQAEELATTQERNRIAREIHDNLGHYLTVVNVQIEAAKVVMAHNPDKARDALDKAQALTQEGLNAVRQSVAALREGPVGNRPIPDAIADLVRETERGGLAVAYQVNATPRELAPNTALALYRVAQEALTNVRKHARAERVAVQLDYGDPQRVRLTVRDDGVGASETETGFGLLGIRERLALLGGDWQVHTAPGKGFTLAVSVPG